MAGPPSPFAWRLGAVFATIVVFGAALSAGSASASPPNGSWKGTLDGGRGTVEFTVSGNQVTEFVAHGKYGTLHCGGNAYSGPSTSSATVYVPSADISGDTFSGTATHDGGETDTLNGQFNGSTASGTVEQHVDPNCGTGELHWTATTSGGASATTKVMSHPRTITLRALLGGGLRLMVASQQLVGVGIVLDVDSPVARRLKIGRKQTVLGKAIATVEGTKVFTVSVNAKYRDKLARATKPFALFIDVDFEDAANDRSTTKSYEVTVRP
jgi:hypothetical protein